MLPISRLILASLILIFLSACQQPALTYDYLITHPLKLKQQLERCEQLSDKTADESTQCQIVMSARDNFISLQEEREADSAKFGIKILDLETTCATEKNKQCALVPVYLAVVGLNSPD